MVTVLCKVPGFTPDQAEGGTISIMSPSGRTGTNPGQPHGVYE